MSVKLRNSEPCAAPSVFTHGLSRWKFFLRVGVIARVFLFDFLLPEPTVAAVFCELAPAKAILHPRWSFFPDNGKRLASRLAWERNTLTER